VGGMGGGLGRNYGTHAKKCKRESLEGVRRHYIEKKEEEGLSNLPEGRGRKGIEK